MDQDCVRTRDLLVQLHFDNIGDNDCKLVKSVCRIVLHRAAYLAAAALAALIQHVQQHDVTIAIDGSLWRYHHRFKQQMEARTRELVEPKYKVKFLSLLDGSGIGAALTTAVSLQSSFDTVHPTHDDQIFCSAENSCAAAGHTEL
ncbi:hypothetical protein V1264_016844 [Littorina saxatilis]|uniref:Phosphotransferase n=1 Tax=Littorina saxatilis TaxID=31220 RepID=A0AAN9BG13_9CAEN